MQGIGGFKIFLFLKGPPTPAEGEDALKASKAQGPKALLVSVGTRVRRKGPLRAASALNLKLQTPGEIPA